jgi:hypothetical protein
MRANLQVDQLKSAFTLCDLLSQAGCQFRKQIPSLL